jgi:hypothetical protein
MSQCIPGITPPISANAPPSACVERRRVREHASAIVSLALDWAAGLRGCGAAGHQNELEPPVELESKFNKMPPTPPWWPWPRRRLLRLLGSSVHSVHSVHATVVGNTDHVVVDPVDGRCVRILRLADVHRRLATRGNTSPDSDGSAATTLSNRSRSWRSSGRVKALNAAGGTESAE